MPANIAIAPEKITETSLSAYLNCAYQRLFLIEGERYRVQVEIDTLPPDLSDDIRQQNAQKRLYLSAIIGSIEEEKRAINQAIKNAVGHGN